MQYVQYDPETGRIMAHVCIPEDDRAAVERHKGRSGPLVPYDGECGTETHYVCDGSVISRPVLTPGHERIPGGFRLLGLPIPCVVHVDGRTYEVDDGELEWITTVSGIRQVRVEAWPYLEWSMEVQP